MESKIKEGKGRRKIKEGQREIGEGNREGREGDIQGREARERKRRKEGKRDGKDKEYRNRNRMCGKAVCNISQGKFSMCVVMFTYIYSLDINLSHSLCFPFSVLYFSHSFHSYFSSSLNIFHFHSLLSFAQNTWPCDA